MRAVAAPPSGKGAHVMSIRNMPPGGRPAGAIRAPAVPTELAEFIATLFREVLDLPGVGLDDDFFDLGADSIHVLRVATRLESELDSDFDIDLLFEHSTAHELAASLAPRDAAV